MGAVLITFSVLFFIAAITITVFRSAHNRKLNAKIALTEKEEGTKISDERLASFRENNAFFIPAKTSMFVSLVAVVMLGTGLFNKVWFYAEPGFVYHVRTITGEERVVNTVGYSYYLFGRTNAWKKAMTVQASSVNSGTSDALSGESEGGANTSASLPPMNIMFLDQVDANAHATARFRIPTDRESFLKMAHEYRTPDNLLRTALIPAFKETLNATGSLMTAEEYYAGGRTEFNNEFEVQMQDGIYLVKRKEVRVADQVARAKGSANASIADQEEFGDATKVIFKVEKMYGEDGATPLRKTQTFLDYGVQVVEARVTDMKPNLKFVERMQLKQKASADRAIAREQRIQEEEQKLLAVAKGDREVAQKQAEAKVIQISKTTEAETTKQLALTKANQQKEQAAIDKETAAIRLEQARIDAEKIKTLADAEAYKKEQIIKADNALQQKLETEIEIQKVWAAAYAKRAVPTNVFGSGGDTPVGGDSETSNFMKLMTLDAAKRLNYDRSLETTKQ